MITSAARSQRESSLQSGRLSYLKTTTLIDI
jgi:hypothetical protein